MQVVDNKDGTYDLSYTILSPGSDFQLYIHYDGVDIPGSPFHLKIFPNIMVPKNSIAVIPTTVLQDSFSTIKIYFFDKFQNPVVLSAINYFRISVIVDKNLVKAEFSVDDGMNNRLFSCVFIFQIFWNAHIAQFQFPVILFLFL